MEGTFGFIEKRIIGNGSFLAYKTYNKSHGKLVQQHYRRELWALKHLNITSKDSSVKNHVVHLIDNQETSTCYHLIFPFYNSTLLAHATKKDRALALDFVKQISKGLAYLHSHNIIHCDLSPSNILIDELSGCMVICDFGCAHPNSNSLTDTTEEIGTRYYKAPEHLFGSKKYASSTDVWSLGSIYAELLFGYPIFAGETDIEQVGRIIGRLGKPSDKVETEEMSDYPDTNKLMFFSCASSDDESDFDFESDDEEMILVKANRKSLKQLMQEENLSETEQNLVVRILTWSIKERMSLPEITLLTQQ
ncbi:kinase-like domain-containing protein [Mucor mucedo]|uniref:kinase-like domain-containing protein n=1 Tax=Mucor mucedo TaxID=29922 RepID=UPI00221F3830|nr:kinase-like domain-containing protein [Mucor mucedo]KAI7894621.1 kinase-like domain-containing protein [Mucor mucedo]